MLKIISFSLYSFIFLIIMMIGVSCGYEDLDTSEENKTSTDTFFTITLSDGTQETLSFQTPIELSGVGAQPLAFEVKDINNDSKEDIVLLNNSHNEDLRAITILTRTTSDSSSDAGDWFTISTKVIDKTPQHLVIEDVNGDNKEDIIVVHAYDDDEVDEEIISYWIGELSDNSYSLPSTAIEITVGDFPVFIASGNFDGTNTGVVVANYNSDYFSVISDFGASTITADSVTHSTDIDDKTTTVQTLTEKWRNSSTCDDVATLLRNDNKVVLYKNTSCSLSFEKLGEQEVGSSPLGMISGDWDHDDNLDLAVTNSGDSSISILYGNGDGTFDRVDVGVGESPSQLASTDFNGDGVEDFIVGNTSEKDLSILLSNGLANRQSDSTSIYERGDIAAGTKLSGSRPSYIKVADINNDGKMDIIVTLPFENKISFILRN